MQPSPAVARPRPVQSREFIASLADGGSFRSWDSAVCPETPSAEYAAALSTAASLSGADESVITGEATVDGRPVAVIVSEFGFLGGSVGLASARRIVAAVRRATAERLPLVSSTASGGTRMHEGTPAFVAMIDIAAAVEAHKRAGLLYLVYLRDPTTGGVLATWGSMGHITLAQPGALIGLVGPRVQRLVTGAAPPSESLRAEAALRAGQIDAVIAVAEVRPLVSHVLELLARGSSDPGLTSGAATSSGLAAGSADGWDAVRASRRRDRPGARELLAALGANALVLHGDRDAADAADADAAVLLAVARFGDQPCVVVAHDRRAQQAGARPGLAALSLVVRAVRLAADLGIPLVTVIDTPGVAMGGQPAAAGLAAAVADAVAALLSAETPVVSVLLGEGGGAAALAMFPADRRVAVEHAWLAPLPPEAASALVYRNPDRAADIAREQRISARELFDAAVVDRVVPECGDGAEASDAFCARLAEVIADEVQRVLREPQWRSRRGQGVRRQLIQER